MFSRFRQSLSSIKQSLFHGSCKAIYTQRVNNLEEPTAMGSDELTHKNHNPVDGIQNLKNGHASLTAVLQNHRDCVLNAHPSEQELIESYLRPYVVSGDKSCNFIHDGDVYADHPNVFAREYAAAVSSNGDGVWYFFTAMRARAKRRKGRKVDSGEGFWHTESKPKRVVSANRQLLGYRRYLKFARKEGGRRVRSKWAMVELGLHNDGQDKVTLCKVCLSLRPCRRKAAADMNDPVRCRARKRTCPLRRASSCSW